MDPLRDPYDAVTMTYHPRQTDTRYIAIAVDRYRLLQYHPSSESPAVSKGMDSFMEPYDAEAMTYNP